MDIWLIAVSMAATATAITDIFSIIFSPHFLFCFKQVIKFNLKQFAQFFCFQCCEFP
nr:MAG TPA: hypothetical protein [Caudoviricetes sp.]